VALYRFASLVPSAEIWPWIRRAEALLAEADPADPVDLLALRAHQGRALTCQGEWSAAKTALLESVGEAPRANTHPPLLARNLGDLADLLRLLGEHEAAQASLTEAGQLQQRGGFLGDYADFTLLTRAKLAVAAADARQCLIEAEAIQTRGGSRMGLARTLLLRARLFPADAEVGSTRARLGELRARVPALASCPLLGKILAHWETWTSGSSTAAQEKDYFWGV
jgi:hypothetical protein